MATNVTSSRHVPPVYGWASIAAALTAVIVLVGSLTLTALGVGGQVASGQGIGAVAGGTVLTIGFLLSLTLLMVGVILGVVGLIRHESRRWIPAAGIAANLAAPFVIWGAMRLLFG